LLPGLLAPPGTSGSQSEGRGPGGGTRNARSGPQGWRGPISQAGTCLKPLTSLDHLMVARSSSLAPSIRTFIPLSGSSWESRARVVMPPAPERLRVDRLVRPVSGSRSVMPVEPRSSEDRLIRPLSGSRSIMPVEVRLRYDRLVRPLSGSTLVIPVRPRLSDDSFQLRKRSRWSYRWGPHHCYASGVDVQWAADRWRWSFSPPVGPMAVTQTARGARLLVRPNLQPKVHHLEQIPRSCMARFGQENGRPPQHFSTPPPECPIAVPAEHSPIINLVHTPFLHRRSERGPPTGWGVVASARRSGRGAFTGYVLRGVSAGLSFIQN
jgi:hypothetical protein